MIDGARRVFEFLTIKLVKSIGCSSFFLRQGIEKCNTFQARNVNFRSLCYRFATKLIENGVMQEQIGYLMEHKGKHLVSTVYSEGVNMEQLRE